MAEAIPSPSMLPGLPGALIPHIYPGIRLGLEPLAQTLHRLGDPQNSLPTILVGGTNGKGSTVAFLASMLKEAGAKVGTFTSPSLRDFGGHMAIDGLPPLGGVLEALSATVLAAMTEPLTPFELALALAFLHFKGSRVDMALIEVGMGGAMDATNLSDPMISVVTQVAMDHQAFLGDTLEAIATEKGGIARRGRPFLTAAEGRGGRALLRRVEALGGRCLPLADLGTLAGTWRDAAFHMEGLEPLGPCPLGLPGDHQRLNAALALGCVAQIRGVGEASGLGPWVHRLTGDVLLRGLRGARLPGRLTWVSHRPPILFDGAHNPHGAEALRGSLGSLLGGRDVAMVMGLYRDKDAKTMVNTLGPLATRIATVTPSGRRGLDKDELLTLIPSGVTGKAWEDLGEAVAWAGQAGAVVLVWGSLSLYAPLLDALGPAAEPGARI